MARGKREHLPGIGVRLRDSPEVVLKSGQAVNQVGIDGRSLDVILQQPRRGRISAELVGQLHEVEDGGRILYFELE
jgi:hypothetical protein